ncbi:MAG: hypothetical protein KatS3mg057_0188 [Herpetosiphonaceae bacterium]|nr:MAG: hypothetical protein KatS3mg057_0188 [Herpetosiphonaceae bacterium]
MKFRYFDMRFIDHTARELKTRGWLALLWGLLMIVWGIALIIWPELLVALVAALFISIGIITLTIAWQSWVMKRSYEQIKDDIFPRQRMVRIPVTRRPRFRWWPWK